MNSKLRIVSEGTGSSTRVFVCKDGCEKELDAPISKVEIYDILPENPVVARITFANIDLDIVGEEEALYIDPMDGSPWNPGDILPEEPGRYLIEVYQYRSAAGREKYGHEKTHAIDRLQDFGKGLQWLHHHSEDSPVLRWMTIPE